MTRDEYNAAFEARAFALGFVRRAPNEYGIPGGGVLVHIHRGIALTRDAWCYEQQWRLHMADVSSMTALWQLYLACADLPARFGHSDVTQPTGPAPLYPERTVQSATRPRVLELTAHDLEQMRLRQRGG